VNYKLKASNKLKPVAQHTVRLFVITKMSLLDRVLEFTLF